MIKPYVMDVAGRGNLEVFANDGEIVVYDNEYDEYIKYGTDQVVTPVNVVPATRKEIQDAGLWDYVINKEDFSNVDEELEEYLKIGEKVLEERKKS